MKIKIGADELILWLRRNKIVNGTIPNDGTHGLGFEICRIIEGLKGKKIESNNLADWPDNDPKKIGQYGLPKTSALYKIELDDLSKVYAALLKLYNPNAFDDINKSSN